MCKNNFLSDFFIFYGSTTPENGPVCASQRKED